MGRVWSLLVRKQAAAVPEDSGFTETRQSSWRGCVGAGRSGAAVGQGSSRFSQLTSEGLVAAPGVTWHLVYKCSVLFIAVLIWNICLFEINLKSKASSTGVAPRFLFKFSGSARKALVRINGSQPAEAPLLGFRLKIFLRFRFLRHCVKKLGSSSLFSCLLLKWQVSKE